MKNIKIGKGLLDKLSALKKAPKTKAEEVNDLAPTMDGIRREKLRSVTSNHVRIWFERGWRAMGVTPSPWTGKEAALSKRILEAYGAELTERGVEHLFAEWPSMRSGGKVRGTPSVAFLWGARTLIFGELEMWEVHGKADPKNADEWKGDRAHVCTEDDNGLS